MRTTNERIKNMKVTTNPFKKTSPKVKQVDRTILANLIAQEKLTVVFANVQTASFNLKTRTITMPLLEGLTDAMRDTYVIHECGHALWTPQNWTCDPTNKNNPDYVYFDKKYFGFVNVVEDAREERETKAYLPGATKVMVQGYKDFMEKDFFKLDGKNPNDLLLIDRINLRFKLGINFNINFTDEEQVFVDRVAVCNEDEVIPLAIEIYNYCKKEQKEKEQQQQEQMSDDMDFDSDDSDDNPVNNFESFDDQDNDDTNDNTSEDSDENSSEEIVNVSNEDSDDDSSEENDNSYGVSEEIGEESDDELDVGYTKGSDHTEVISETDTSFAQSIANSSSDKEITNGNFTEFDISPLVINWKKVQILKDNYLYLKKEKYSHENTLLRFEKDNKSSIDYLVKEFEMRKKASAYKRTRVASTGSIDPNKLHSYKFNDDIFRKIGVTPDGKNHGVTLFVDFSGSMYDLFKPTIDQLITVTHFLRKVSIPFEVYAFTTGYVHDMEEVKTLVKKTNLNYKNGDMKFREQLDNLCVLNLLSSKMTNTQYRKMADDLLDAGELTINYYRLVNRGKVNRSSVFDKHLKHSRAEWNFSMCGTPLNLLLNGSVDMINKFKVDNKIENHTVLFITDGADYDYAYTYSSDEETDKEGDVIYPSSQNKVSYVKDSKSGKIYKTHHRSITPTLVERLKDRTNSTVMNFFIVHNRVHEIENEFRRHGLPVYAHDSNGVDPIKKFRAEKSASAYDFGFDEVIIIPDNALTLDNDSLDDLVSSNDSIRKITSAFKKMNKSRLTNRIFLSKIIENVA